MSNLNEQEIEEIMENGNVGEIMVPYGDDITDYLSEWEDLIEELSDKEVALFKWKHVYNVKSEEIIAETDFKKLYGANNQTVRNTHVRNELSDWYDTIKDLEFSIDYLNRRIVFLKELVRTKRVLMEVKQ